MLRVLPVIFAVALIIYTFIDCARTDSSAMPAKISKPLWLALIALVPVLGALIWLYFKYQHIFTSDYPSPSFGGQNPFSRPRPPKGPVAPDDDPEFLARLEARNRRRAYEERMREEGRLPEQDERLDDKHDEDRDEGGLYGNR